MNKLEKRLLKIKHEMLIGMFEELLDSYSDLIGVNRKVARDMLIEELKK
jgi:hypothetical protein